MSSPSLLPPAFFTLVKGAQAVPFAAGGAFMLHMNAVQMQFAALQQAHMCYVNAMATAAACNISIDGQTRANIEAWCANLESQTKNT